MSNIFLIFLISFSTGIFASLGLGGGFILILYLTIFSGLDQITAQVYNLIFFIPISILSIIMHFKNGLIEKNVLFPIILSGMLGTLLGVYISTIIGAYFLSKVFAVFILVIGIKELLRKSK